MTTTANDIRVETATIGHSLDLAATRVNVLFGTTRKAQAAAAPGSPADRHTTEAVNLIETALAQLRDAGQACSRTGSVLRSADTATGDADVATQLGTALELLEATSASTDEAETNLDRAADHCSAAKLEPLSRSLQQACDGTGRIAFRLADVRDEIEWMEESVAPARVAGVSTSH